MAHEETVYEALDHAHGGEGQWAFGTGFDDPLAGVDTTVPDGVDPADLGAYCLMLGDDALVLAQRLTQWVTAAPELEEEVALANIALDLLGQARLLLARAGSVGVLGRSRTLAGDTIPDEDALAYFRDPDEFRCTALVERPERGLRADDRPAAGRLHLCGWRCSPGCASPATRCWPRSPPRASTSWPTTATTPPAGCCGSATARRSRTAGRRPASTPSGRCWPTLFTATDVETRLTAAGVAVDPATTRDEVRAVLDRGAERGDAAACPAWPADAAAARPPRRARPGAGRAARRAAGAGPRAPGGDLVSGDDQDRWTRGVVAETVTDPELPMLTLADLGVLRDVRVERDGTVVVEITPTYTGCPAMGVMRADLVHALHQAGFAEVDVRTVLSPAWSTDWITEDGRRKLRRGRHRAARDGARSAPRARCRCSWARPGGRRPARCAARPTPRS